MKKIHVGLLKMRIRVLKKFLAILGTSAFLVSCGGGNQEAENQSNDTLVDQIDIVDEIVVEPVSEIDEQTTNQTQTGDNKPPKEPATIDIDYLEEPPQTKYGSPSSFNID
jgi:hypothetical protein